MIKYKLSKNWRKELDKVPETGMGYHVISLTFEDGKTISNIKVSNEEDFEIKDKINLNKIVKMQVNINAFDASNTIKKIIKE